MKDPFEPLLDVKKFLSSAAACGWEVALWGIDAVKLLVLLWF